MIVNKTRDRGDQQPSNSIFKGAEHIVGALAMVAAATLLGLWMAPRWGTGPVDMLYLPAVLAAAGLWGLGPALIGATAAALAYNFFFTTPIHTFRMDRVTDVVTVVMLFVVALVTSRLAAGMRAQARIAAAHAARNATIAGFARRLLSCSGEEEIAVATCAELHRLFDCNAMLLTDLPEPRIVGADPVGNRLTPSDLAAAAMAIDSGEAAGRWTARLQPAEWTFFPVQSSARVLGAMGLARDDGTNAVSDEQRPLLISLLDQLALALERSRLEREASEFAATRERDRMRSALLSSIGQDMTPRLTAIGNAVRALKRGGSADRQLLSVIGGEASKLDRYMENLLDLGPEANDGAITVGDVTIDLFNRSVAKGGKQVHLTPKEFALLSELAKHRGRVLTHSYLLRAIWGPAQEGQIEYLRVAIRGLRLKLEDEPATPSLILNEPAVGYRLAGALAAR